MKNLSLSIIIPTFNRKATLKKCLNALFNQSHPQSEYEVMVVDDGSTDGTEGVIKSRKKSAPGALKYLRQAHKGPAAARNLGIRNAEGEIVLFIGDDIIADKRLIEKHIKFHSSHPEENIALLGYVTWSKELKVTPFMHWLEKGGPQFAYWRLKDGEEVSYQYFYTCNLSLKRKFLLENGLFDEDFQYAAFEDTELGYRLQEKDLRIIFNRDAIGCHFHPISLSGFCSQARVRGRSAVILHQKRPELIFLPERKGILRILEALRGAVIPLVGPILNAIDKCYIKVPLFIYRKILGYYYYLGVKEGGQA